MPHESTMMFVVEIVLYFALCSVRVITVLCDLRKQDLILVISCLFRLTFLVIFHVISIQFCPQTHFGPMFLKK